MVYVNGDDINSDIKHNIIQMEEAAATLPDSVKIVVLYSQPTLLPESSEFPVYPTDNGEQVWEAPNTTGVGVIQPRPPGASADVIFTRFQLSRSNVGDARTLQNFIITTEQAYPAQQYALILSDHGGGVTGFNFDKNFEPISPGDSHLTVRKLVSAITTAEASGSRLDLLAFDECLMGGTELAFAVRDLVPYVVASEESVGGAGFDYSTVFDVLAQDPQGVTAEDLGRAMVRSYDEQYQKESRQLDTLSLVQTGELDALSASLRRFVIDTSSARPQDWAALRRARSFANKFGGVRGRHFPFRDLGQFLSRAADSVPNPRIRQDARAALNALQRAVLARTDDQRHSTGLSIVLPVSPEKNPPDYNRQAAAFLSASGWYTFLNRFRTVGAGSACTLAADWAEYNDDHKDPTGLGTVFGPGVRIPELTLPRGDVDWYSFSTVETGGPSDAIVLDSGGAAEDARLQLFRSDELSQPVASGNGRISLNGLPEANYLLEVSHGGKRLSFGYTLALDAPRSTNPKPVPSPGQTIDLGSFLDPGLATPSVPVGTDTETFAVLDRLDASQPASFTFGTPRSITPLRGAVRVFGGTARNLTVTLSSEEGRVLARSRGRKAVELFYKASGSGESYTLTVGGGAGTYQIFFAGLV